MKVVKVQVRALVLERSFLTFDEYLSLVTHVLPSFDACLGDQAPHSLVRFLDQAQGPTANTAPYPTIPVLPTPPSP